MNERTRTLKKKTEERNPRLGKVGGQALLEGIMMRSGDETAISVRAMDGTIRSKKMQFVSLRKKYKFLGIPFIRGMVSFVESLVMSYKTMDEGVNMLGIEEEETKFEKWLKKKFGANLMDVLMPIAMVLGIFLALGIFVFLPTLIASWIAIPFGGDIGIWKSISLITYDSACISEFHVTQRHENGKVYVTPYVNIKGDTAKKTTLHLTVKTPDGDHFELIENEESEISNPRLWWPNGMGDQPQRS